MASILGNDAQYEEVSSGDAPRTPESALCADPRMEGFAAIDSGGVRPYSLDDRFQAVSALELHRAVPHVIRVHFETAKNLYLYGWFVYRFNAIAEQQALTMLEFALREKLGGKAKAAGKRNQMTLTPLLKLALKQGLISNAGFRNRATWAQRRARFRHHVNVVTEMQEQGLTELRYEDAFIEPTAEDLDFDWLGVFIDTLPKIRNEYAHGSRMVRADVLHTFDIATDLINQLYQTHPVGQ